MPRANITSVRKQPLSGLDLRGQSLGGPIGWVKSFGLHDTSVRRTYAMNCRRRSLVRRAGHVPFLTYFPGTTSVASCKRHPSWVVGILRWSRFDGHQCGLENKRHNHEKEIFQFISPAVQDGLTYILRRIQATGIDDDPPWTVGALSRTSAGY